MTIWGTVSTANVKVDKDYWCSAELNHLLHCGVYIRSNVLSGYTSHMTAAAMFLVLFSYRS